MGQVALTNGYARTVKRVVHIQTDEPREMLFFSAEDCDRVTAQLDADGMLYTMEDVEDPADAWIDGQFFGDDKSVMDEALRIRRTLEEFKAQRLSELSAACRTAIVAGVDVGDAHYTLNEDDQINIGNLAIAAAQGQPVLYHADDELCRPYLPQEMTDLAAAAIGHKVYHTTYYNHLKAWVRRLEEIDAVAAVQYGTALPDDLAARMAEVLGG